jgi:hypothetical protein
MCKHREASELTLAPRFLELAIPCRMNFSLSAGEHIVRCNVADSAVQAHSVVVIHVSLN